MSTSCCSVLLEWRFDVLFLLIFIGAVPCDICELSKRLSASVKSMATAARSATSAWKRELDDDTVEYFVFPKLSPCSTKSEAIEQLNDMKDSFMGALQSDLELYIWQNEPFSLHVPPEAGFQLSQSLGDKTGSTQDTGNDVLPPFLWGRTTYADCADDEWFVVYLVQRLTNKFPGTVARLSDADGEFLLIEAADHVPGGYDDPETAERRVFLFEGTVHLLPLIFTDETSDGLPVTMAAVDSVRDSGAATRASDELQECIQRKTDGYPGKITESHHRATVRLPAAAAALITTCPRLLPAAVQAFYLRDPLDARACRAMRFFPPETCVRASVVFTKTLYAQLVQQRYRPDVRTGWQIPAPTEQGFREADVGMKLACGLEILASRAGTQSDAAAAAGDTTLDELRDDVRWQRYLTSLRQKQYFGELLEGSQEHTALLEKARQYYVGHMMKEDRHSAPGDVVRQLIASVKVDHAQWKKQESQLPPPDDDSWLEMSADQLEQLLQQQFELQQQPPEQVAAELKEFLSRLSGLDGVETESGGTASRKTSRARKPSRKLSAAVMRKISTLSQASTASGMSSLSAKIDFNADSFTDAVRGMLDLGLEDDDWSDDGSSGMSSYGEEDGAPALRELLEEEGASGDGEVKALMAQMDEELRDSTLAESFVRATKAVRKESGASDASLDDIESFQPVDIDANAVQNLLQSLRGQTAAAGPAQTLLESLTKEKQQQ